MGQNEILNLLDDAISRGSVISVERPEIAETELLCIPIARSEELLFVHAFYNFKSDGYSILRIEDIYDILREKSEIFFERVINAEGVYAALNAPACINLTSWRGAIESLKSLYDYFIIECDKEDDFLIGKVTELRDWDFSFWYFDATGKWDDELDVIDYDELTTISFDDDYTKTIIKYIPLPGEPPKEQE